MSEARRVSGAAERRPTARAGRGAVRRLLVKWHRWIALAVSLPLLLQMGTGFALVFKPEVIGWTATPSGLVAEGRVRFETVVEAVAKAEPGARITRVDFPAAADAPYVFHLQRGERPHFVAASKDGRVEALGPAAAAMETVRALHDDLATPGLGQVTVAVSGVALTLLGASGLWLWWPGRSGWRQALRFPLAGGARQILFLWHRSVGAIAGVILVVAGVTGTCLALNTWLTSTPWREIDAPPAANAAGRIAFAQAYFPNFVVRDVRLAPGGGIERVLLIAPARNGPVRQVRFDPATGRPTAVADPMAAGIGSAFWAWLYPLHTAQAGGVTARGALAISSLAGIAIVLSGVALWVLRRPKKARRAQ